MEKKENIFDFYGIVLYDIELNGCLNGVYTHMGETHRGEIFNEICKKKSTDNPLGILGTYDCTFFDRNGGSIIHPVCTLQIDLHNENPLIFFFKWHDGAEFEGIGYRMNDKQIAVSYWAL